MPRKLVQFQGESKANFQRRLAQQRQSLQTAPNRTNTKGQPRANPPRNRNSGRSPGSYSGVSNSDLVANRMRLTSSEEFAGKGPHKKWVPFIDPSKGLLYRTMSLDVEVRSFLCGACHDGTILMKVYRVQPDESSLDVPKMAVERHVTMLKASKIVGTTKVRVEIPPREPGESDQHYGLQILADFTGRIVSAIDKGEWKDHELDPTASRWDLQVHINTVQVHSEW